MIEVEVRDSQIHGKGVFAKEDVNSGELVGVFEGRIVWESKDMSDENPYVLWLEDDEGRAFGINCEGNMRYLNHDSDSPNAILAANSPFIYCSQPIKAGDEIRVMYTEETDFSEDEEKD